MDNYFISYSKGKKRFIIPEVSIISNDTNRPSIEEVDENPIHMESCRATDKFNPYIIRCSHPIVLSAFIYGPDSQFYEVTEGLYMLNSGTLKMKVKTKYGK